MNVLFEDYMNSQDSPEVIAEKKNIHPLNFRIRFSKWALDQFTKNDLKNKYPRTCEQFKALLQEKRTIEKNRKKTGIERYRGLK